MNRVREIDRTGGALPVLRHDRNAHPEQHSPPASNQPHDEVPEAPPVPKPSLNPGLGGIVDTFATSHRTSFQQVLT